ncbi:MAG: hypothetical protein ACXW05_11810, partial [Gemmatirosa sp.]
DYHGHVRACNYSRESKQLGNVLREPYGSIFSQRASFLFHNAPSPGGVDCAGCAYYAHCRGCFVKAFMVSETQYPGCPWRQRWFRDMPLALDDERHAPPTPASERRRALPVFSDADGRPLCTSCATSA